MKTTAGLTLLALLLSLPLAAQQPPTQPDASDEQIENAPVAVRERPQRELYGGIIPGTRDTLPHLNHRHRRAHQLSWIGFTPEDTRTRIFIKADPNIPYQMSRSEDGTQIFVTFENTAVENYNLVRFIDASFYKRAVSRIDASRKRGDVTITMTVEPGAEPRVDQSGEYIFFDFPHTAR